MILKGDVPRKGNVDRNVGGAKTDAGTDRDVPRKGNVDRNGLRNR